MGNQHSIIRRSSVRGLMSSFQLKGLIPKSCFKNLTVITEESNDVAGTDNGSGSSLTGYEGSRNEQEDRISKFPDPILINILSLLPTHDAIRTLVIKTFGDKWSFTQNLDFDLCLYHDSSSCDDLDESVDEKFVNLVRNILIHHKSPTIFNFRLRFPLRLDYVDLRSLDPRFMTRQMRFDSEINSWIEYALKKEVKVLDLNFLPRPHSFYEEYYKLPRIVLTSGSLTKLKLASCVMRPQAEIHMRSLESLSLTNIMLSRDTIEKILSGCPLLENLSLIQCDGLFELNITSQRLNCLMVVRSSGSMLEISCPYVTSLNISGWIDGIALKNSSSLVDATLEFTENSYYSCDEHLPGIVSLLRNSPSLEMLTIFIHPSGPPFCAVDDVLHQSYDVGSAEPSFHCLAKSLKTVTLCGYVTEPWAIQVVQFLLKSAMVLEKMTISTKRNVNPDHRNHFTSEKMHKFSEMLSNFPRGSTCAEILFS